MSGQLVGLVISAADELRERGLSQRGFYALIAISEKAGTTTRQASVRWDHICAGLYGASKRTAERAVQDLKTAGLVTVKRPGFDNGHGHAQAPIYQVNRIGDTDTWMSVSVQGDTDTQVSVSVPTDTDKTATDTDRLGDRYRQNGDRYRHPGVVLDGSIDGPIDGSLDSRGQQIVECGLCDDDGYRNSIPCDHVDRTDIAARGSARVRAALSAKSTS